MIKAARAAGKPTTRKEDPTAAFTKIQEKIQAKIQAVSAKMIGAKQFVLMIGDDGAVLILIQSGRVSRRLYAPSPAPEHVLPFLELLRLNSRVPISIMLDVMDQSYVRHSFPPVSPLSIKKLVSRRMDRDFSAEDIRGSMLIGRESDGRREWNYLLISVANSSMIQQWTELIVELPNQLLGMYLIPIEAQNFINDLARLSSASPAMKASWRLMVCHDKVSGYRQIVLKDNQLVFTRLTQAISDMTPEATASMLEQEILSTIEYLRRLSYTDQAGLEVYVIISDDIKNLIKNDRINATSMKNFSPFEVAEMMRLDQAALSGDRFGDVVLAANFGMGAKRKLRLMPPYAQKLMLLYRSSAALKLGTVGLLMLLTYFIISGFISASEVKSTVNMTRQEKQTALDDIAKAEKVLEGLGAMQGEVLNVATLYGVALQKQQLPLDFVRNMAKVVDDTRLVRVLDWRFDTELMHKAAAKPAQPAKPAKGASKVAPVTETEPIVAKVEIKLMGHGGDRKNFMNMAYRLFGDAKVAFEGYTVENDPLPGVTTNADSLKLDFDDSGKDEHVEDAQTIVVLRIKGPIPPVPSEPEPKTDKAKP